MKKLIIRTKHHITVYALLQEHDLVETNRTDIIDHDFMVLSYPNDAVSQEFAFWAALAQGCGLIIDYRLDS